MATLTDTEGIKARVRELVAHHAPKAIALARDRYRRALAFEFAHPRDDLCTSDGRAFERRVNAGRSPSMRSTAAAERTPLAELP